MSKASFSHSPIGPIPQDFPRLKELCRVASIRYRDETVNHDGKEVVYRSWAVVPDPKPALDGRGNIQGSASTIFRKFSMLLDLLEHDHPTWTHMQILTEALDLTNPTYRALMMKSWRQMHTELVKLGVNNYQTLKAKRESLSERDLPEL